MVSTLIKVLIRGSILILVLGILGATGLFAKIFPERHSLAQKDPEKYQMMLDQFKSGSIEEGWNMYQLLHTHSSEEMLAIRYREMKQKWLDDKEFRMKDLERQLELKTASSNERMKNHEVRFVQLSKEKKNRGPLVWDHLTPWRKTMILREKCIKFIELEKKDIQRRRNLFSAVRTSRLSIGKRGRTMSSEEFCGLLVPLKDDETVVVHAIRQLKEKMNYYYFSEMIREMGVNLEKIYAFPDQAQRMVEDFNSG